MCVGAWMCGCGCVGMRGCVGVDVCGCVDVWMGVLGQTDRTLLRRSTPALLSTLTGQEASMAPKPRRLCNTVSDVLGSRAHRCNNRLTA